MFPFAHLGVALQYFEIPFDPYSIRAEHRGLPDDGSVPLECVLFPERGKFCFRIVDKQEVIRS